MDDPFEKFPLFLKAKDISDATQYGRTTVYELIRKIEIQIPKAVIRRGERGIRVYGPLFWPWFMKREGIGQNYVQTS